MAILHYGQQRGEVRTDIPLQKLACYVGVLCVSLFYGLFEPGPSTRYAVEVDILLTFMSTALR